MLDNFISVYNRITRRLSAGHYPQQQITAVSPAVRDATARVAAVIAGLSQTDHTAGDLHSYCQFSPNSPGKLSYLEEGKQTVNLMIRIPNRHDKTLAEYK